ncbi:MULTISPECIES: hypothetical protein [unclassified Corallococcus]|uniref:hypothetical protein n=1 Tax=unclassified Corallococcus TaxID=2685029 RepID=UPI001A8DF232|nr:MULTISPECIES: hypothetical protein [unclassified Corallococcus]MBN9685101.1 hypothetical protein [Corallococcus sp. NCSPR001]WAS83440.1 hypothetical protein O0N60_29510 [Corallococcus sp. NCRR]
MTLLRRSLLLVPTLLLAPLTASARPPDCTNDYCERESCAELCLEAGHIITCGDYGVCISSPFAQPSEPRASVQPVDTDDASKAVCREPAAQS